MNEQGCGARQAHLVSLQQGKIRGKAQEAGVPDYPMERGAAIRRARTSRGSAMEWTEAILRCVVMIGNDRRPFKISPGYLARAYAGPPCTPNYTTGEERPDAAEH